MIPPEEQQRIESEAQILKDQLDHLAVIENALRNAYMTRVEYLRSQERVKELELLLKQIHGDVTCFDNDYSVTQDTLTQLNKFILNEKR